jgi:putative hydrolase of the HAD superfamily
MTGAMITAEANAGWPGREVDLLCLDAGNTVVYLDHARLAASAGRQGFDITPDAVERAEDLAMRDVFRGEAIAIAWSHARVPAARGWGVLLGTLFVRAGATAEQAASLVEALWEEHLAYNFWSRVADGLAHAIEDARATGLRTVIVSNSEGKLEALLARLGILALFDKVIDSGVVGIEKPDPRIFEIALEAAGIPAARAIHLGDSEADVLGALGAGIRVALIDPHHRLEGRHPAVPRVASAREVTSRLAALRRA